MLKCVIVLLGVCLLAVFAERVRYDNHHYYHVIPKDDLAVKALEALEVIKGFRFIDGIHPAGHRLPVIVAPEHVSKFEGILRKINIEFELFETDFQKELEEEEQAILNHRASDVYDWTEYHTLEETYAWLEELSEKYPQIVTLITAGKTSENRKILGVKVSHKAGNKGIFIEAGMHSREWIGPATSTYIINELVTSQEPSVRDLAENYDWYIFPHTNPDGYAYTWDANGDRLWRLTRSRQSSGCYGVDGNRNWDFHWREVGSSMVECSETYAGPSAFSEIETKTFSDYIRTLKGKIQLYISFHSYSQLLLYPYGHTQKLPANIDDYRKIFDVSVEAMKQRYGRQYTGGNIYDAIYPASGATIDWAFGTQGIKLAFCYELRPTQLSTDGIRYGFKLPAVQIIPTAEETVDSITAMVNEVKRLKYFD